jgi:hypothetical protein
MNVADRRQPRKEETMTHFAPALVAAAALAFATPALAAPEAECGNSDLLYKDIGQVWITSDGMFDAVTVMGGGFFEFGKALGEETGDATHGYDVDAHAALKFIDQMTQGRTERALDFLATTFDGEADSYRGEAAEVRADINGMQREARLLKRKVRLLRAYLQMAKNHGTPAEVDSLRHKLKYTRTALVEVRAEINAFQADYDKLARIADALDAGREWSETLACFAETN